MGDQQTLTDRVTVRGVSDGRLESIAGALRRYADDHPTARITVYRHCRVLVRVRVIDPKLARKSRFLRADAVWRYLDALDDAVAAEVSEVLMLTPREAEKSLANEDFDEPVDYDAMSREMGLGPDASGSRSAAPSPNGAAPPTGC